MLSLTATIEIKELPAEQLVSRDIYDEEGNITGQISNEEYDQQMKEAQGRVFFGLLVTVDEKVIQLRSEISSPNPDTQREERAFMLSQGLARIGDSIYRNFSK